MNRPAEHQRQVWQMCDVAFDILLFGCSCGIA